MRLGLAYNQKPEPGSSLDEPPSTGDAFAEWDEPSTIDAVEQALRLFGAVVRLEADHTLPARLAAEPLDLVFNMAEGRYGPNRESHVPALCEYLRIPYTGSDPLTLALAHHKGRAKEILGFRGIPTAPFAVLEHPDQCRDVKLPFPLFVKPVAEGSSKGITVYNLCETLARLEERVLYLLEAYGQPVLVERYLPGPEYTVAVLGNGDTARCLPIVGFRFEALPPEAPPIYGFEAKWVWDTPRNPLKIFECPADLPANVAHRIEELSLAAYTALGCRDWCRVDVRLDGDGTPHVLELNPLPGIIPDHATNSCFPKAARAAGMSYHELIQEVVRLAWRRYTSADLPIPGAVVL